MSIERQLYFEWRQFQCQKPATFWSEVFQYIYCILINQSVWVNFLMTKNIIRTEITFSNRSPLKRLYRTVIFKIHFKWFCSAGFPPYYVLLSYRLEGSNLFFIFPSSNCWDSFKLYFNLFNFVWIFPTHTFNPIAL